MINQACAQDEHYVAKNWSTKCCVVITVIVTLILI